MSEELPVPKDPNGDFAVDLPQVASDKEIDAIAREMGLIHFSADKTRKLAKLGVFQAKVGLVHAGVGRITATQDALEKIRDLMVETVEVSQDDEVRVAAAGEANKICANIINSVSKMAELQEMGMIPKPVDTNKVRKFNPEAAINLQINVDGKEVNIQSVPQPNGNADQPHADGDIKPND